MLALHALACVAGFIAGSPLPAAARTTAASCARSTSCAGPAAIAFVAAATLFSLAHAGLRARQQRAPTWPTRSASRPLALLLALLPHALPELFALFLPLAAWSIASRRGAWNELLAATIATTAIAIPLLLLAGGDRDLGHAEHPARAAG